MRLVIRLFIFALFMLASVSLFAGIDSVAVVSNAPATAKDAAIALFGFALLGILLHWFIDLKKAKQQKVGLTLSSYASDTWVSSMISFIICIILIMARKELMGITYFATWQGLFIAFVGYAGDSLLPFFFGFAKKAGINVDAN